MGKALVTYGIADYMSSHPPEMSDYAYRFLAEGDSWFTIGSLNPAKNSNLLFEMEFSVWSAAINAALPGDELRQIAKRKRDPRFALLLDGRLSERWDAILLSAGGNDLIEAAGSSPTSPPDRRLLRPQAEWGPESDGAARYFSEPGWQTFCDYMGRDLDIIFALRDRGRAAGRPVCMHTYAVPTPRPAGAGLGQGPWLLPAMTAYGIPTAHRRDLAALLLKRFGELLKDFAADQGRFPGLDVFDTAALAVDPAADGSNGESGDWINEIHLTWRGCQKLAVPWSQHVESLIAP